MTSRWASARSSVNPLWRHVVWNDPPQPWTRTTGGASLAATPRRLGQPAGAPSTDTRVFAPPEMLLCLSTAWAADAARLLARRLGDRRALEGVGGSVAPTGPGVGAVRERSLHVPH